MTQIRILKIELERAFTGVGIKTAMFCGMLINIVHFMCVVVPQAVDPLKYYTLDGQNLPASVFYAWIGGATNYEYQLFIRLIPILAVMPFAISYFMDCRQGIIKNYYTRAMKKEYLFAKYLSVFLSGGFVVVVPLILNLTATAAVLPSLIWPTGTFPMNANGMWSSLYFTYPYIYFLFYFLLLFVISGLLATITLMVSGFINNRFVGMLFPFILCEFLNAITRISKNYIIRGMAPYRFLSIAQVTYNSWQSYVCIIATFVAGGYWLYYWKGNRDEAL